MHDLKEGRKKGKKENRAVNEGEKKKQEKDKKGFKVKRKEHMDVKEDGEDWGWEEEGTWMWAEREISSYYH